jgi:hypothetical protein
MPESTSGKSSEAGRLDRNSREIIPFGAYFFCTMDEEHNPEVIELLARNYTEQIKTWSLVRAELLEDSDLNLRAEIRAGDAQGIGEYLVQDIHDFTFLVSYDVDKDLVWIELRHRSALDEEMGNWEMYNCYPLCQHEISLQIKGVTNIIKRSYESGYRAGRKGH